MALVQKRMSSKRLTILTVVLVVFFAISLILVIQNYWGGSSSVINTVTNTNTAVQKDLPIITDLGKEVLDDSRLKDLTVHGDFPILPGVIGRTNPFVEALESAE